MLPHLIFPGGEDGAPGLIGGHGIPFRRQKDRGLLVRSSSQVFLQSPLVTLQLQVKTLIVTRIRVIVDIGAVISFIVVAVVSTVIFVVSTVAVLVFDTTAFTSHSVSIASFRQDRAVFPPGAAPPDLFCHGVAA